jgi:hypothetical protein
MSAGIVVSALRSWPIEYVWVSWAWLLQSTTGGDRPAPAAEAGSAPQRARRAGRIILRIGDNGIVRRLLPSHRTLKSLVALVAVALPIAACGGSNHSSSSSTTTTTTATTPASPPTRTTPLISIFGDPAKLLLAPAATLDTVQKLGVQYIRLTVPWAGIAPDPTAAAPPSGFDATSPAAYPDSGWLPYDTIVRDAAARGIGVILDPGAPAPKWASGAGEPAGGLPGVWRPSATEFGQFVQALGARYNGHFTPPSGGPSLPAVHFWSVWNEPNYGPELAPQAIDHSTVEVSPALYRGLVDAAWTGLGQSGHGRDRILIGEIAPRGITTGDNPGNFSGMVPLRFVRALYCVDASLRPLAGAAATARGCPATAAGSHAFAREHPALFQATGFAVHPYPQGAVAPDQPTPGEPDYADLSVLPRLESLLDAAQRVYGSGKRFDLYSTEFGYKTNPPYIAGAPMPLAAEYLNWSEYISWSDPRIRSYNQYLLADPPASSGSRFDTGLEFADGTPKPTLPAFRMPLFLPVTRAHAGAPLTVWGCVRPAVRISGNRPEADIELRPTTGGPFKVLARVPITDASGYFDTSVRFPASGTVRISWAPPGGPAIHSRGVAVTVS